VSANVRITRLAEWRSEEVVVISPGNRGWSIEVGSKVEWQLTKSGGSIAPLHYTFNEGYQQARTLCRVKVVDFVD